MYKKNYAQIVADTDKLDFIMYWLVVDLYEAEERQERQIEIICQEEPDSSVPEQEVSSLVKLIMTTIRHTKEKKSEQDN